MRGQHRTGVRFALFILFGFAFGAGLLASQATGPRSVRFGFETNLSEGRLGFDLETTIAANPGDPRNLVAGWFARGEPFPRDCQSAFTFDGGRTWTRGAGAPRQPGHIVCVDPALAADADGNFYYSYLEGRGEQPPFIDATDLVVAKSTDGGATFSSFSVPFPQQGVKDADKPYIGIDASPASPYRGTIYLGYTLFGDQFFIAVQVSRDGGATWSAPVPVSRRVGDFREGVFGALPVVAPDGTAYVFYMDAKFAAGLTSIKFSRSTDGGLTWSQPANVAANLPSPGLFSLRNASPNFGQDPLAGINGNSLPSAAIAPDGTLFVAWADLPSGSCTNVGPLELQACENTDVRLAVSRNGGQSWSDPVKVTDEANATDQFFPWIGVHADGLVSIAWVDRRHDPMNVNYDVFYTNTVDGRVFLPNVRVTTKISILGENDLADYHGLAAAGDTVFPVWADQRTGADTEVFTARGVLK